MTTFEDVYKAYVACPTRYLHQSRWLMSEATAETLRPLTTRDGHPVWTPRIGGGPDEVPRSEHELLCGIPVDIREDAEGFRLEWRE